MVKDFQNQNRNGENLRLEAQQRRLLIFSVDITKWSSFIQGLILFGGFILFMCLYGYYQELVIYGWFDRKLSIFSTFLQFLGCSIFAQIQKSIINSREIHATQKCDVISLGSASKQTAIFYHALMILIRTFAQGTSNLSMVHINYPVKVLFKSATPVVTVIIGITWFGKSYPFRDYLVVILLLLGLYIFVTSDSAESPASTQWGIFYVLLSMFGSASVPMIQEHCISSYNASVEDLLYHSFLGSTLISLFYCLANGEFFQGMTFLWESSRLYTWWILFAFCTFGFLGANFSTAITAHYGALLNSISNTIRKVVTVALSFLLFPDRNKLNWMKCVGAAIFFLGLLIRIFTKHSNPHVFHKTQEPKPSLEHPVDSRKFTLLTLSQSEKNLVAIDSQNAYIVYEKGDVEGESKVVVDPFPIL